MRGRFEIRRRIPGLRVIVAAVAAVVLAGCADDPAVSYSGNDDAELRVVVGGAGYRDVLEYVAAQNLTPGLRLQLVDATPQANAEVATGRADLAFHQIQPAFLGEPAGSGEQRLSVVSKVDVAPYAIYSSRWKSLADTGNWVDPATGRAKSATGGLPHGGRVAVPATVAGRARALYLLQTVGLLRLDRAFGGLGIADLSVSEANILDSPRHLEIREVDLSAYAADALADYDAVVLDPRAAQGAGLVPGTDALATEPGRGNPYARVLVAPARLAGDERISRLAHALESPAVAEYLNRTYRGAVIAAR
ncbi:MetQ/NlpA family ABC transporter substrate-binding protein [Gordonia sp. ABSL1-1]|uniref:MetQ/NlpA family ABC transporter substrate-binding protein n=1 Tax=Gordonia sp. ABSL1-1 TaxID=3053923 RepID=UPI00257342B8|nr:MetQ/NlpA family ABC transporter substrate-binding protein [Gordonia sp. ABSL1-1]MDL9937790.1 MetQ/NlpA family ABC transporter substrate-binding protein [Gordonia sp. ABSL1-1]